MRQRINMVEPISSLGIAKFAHLFKQIDIELDAEQIQDILWLANQILDSEDISHSTQEVKGLPSSNQVIDNRVDSAESVSVSQSTVSSTMGVSVKPKKSSLSANDSLPFRSPAAPGLDNPLALERSLKYLMRKVPSRHQKIIDEEKTVDKIVEEDLWIPVMKPALERWLDVIILVEEYRSTVIWREIITEFQQMLERQGAFRQVRLWGVEADKNNQVQVFVQQRLSTKQRYCNKKELFDATGNRLILLVSDCISPLWRKGEMQKFLQEISQVNPVAVIQLLPEKFWRRTALGDGFPVQLSAFLPGTLNHKLRVDDLPTWIDIDRQNALNLPIITLDPDSLKQYSQAIAGLGNSRTAGILFELKSSELENSQTIQPQIEENPEEKAKFLVNRFYNTASITARRLAHLMSTVPVSLPVIYLIRKTFLKEAKQVHIAEVFMSGLLEPVQNSYYEFVEGVRELLRDSVRKSETEEVIDKVSEFIANKSGISVKSFDALIDLRNQWNNNAEIRYFAKIACGTLKRLGGRYAAIATDLERDDVGKLGLKSVANSADLERDTSTGTQKREVGENYTRLRDLLANGEWQEADQETERVMLKIMNREKEGWLTLDNCRNFPKEELRIIDQLWLNYSQGKFGFSVQKEIWLKAGGKLDSYDYDTYVKLGDQVGWRKGGSWLSYSELTFINSTRGHLPTAGLLRAAEVKALFSSLNSNI